MADKPFDRTVINPLTRPIGGDINQAQSTEDYALRFLAAQTYGLVTSGFIGAGFQVSGSVGLPGIVTLAPGIGLQTDLSSVPVAINGIVGLDDRYAVKPLILVAPVNVGVPAPPGSDSRYDLIEVRYARRVGDPGPRVGFNTLTGAFEPGVFNTSLSFALSAADLTYNGAGPINYKTGTASGSPGVPSLSAGYLPLAYIHVASGSSTYVKDAISDERALLFPGGGASVTGSFTLTPAGTGSVMLDLSAPPGIDVNVAAFGSGSFGVWVSGGFHASAISVEAGDMSVANVPLWRVRRAQTTIGADKTDLDNPAVNIAYNGAVNAVQKTARFFVDSLQQSGSTPFGFTVVQSQDYTVNFGIALR